MSKKNFEPHYKVFSNNTNYVKVGCSYAGKMIYGDAKCSPEDEFDFQFGYRLAKARCDMNIATAKLARCHQKIDVYRFYAELYAKMLEDEELYEKKLHDQWTGAFEELAVASKFED